VQKFFAPGTPDFFRWQLGKFNLLIGIGKAADRLSSVFGKVMPKANVSQPFADLYLQGTWNSP
jgi:hypothetical protein